MFQWDKSIPSIDIPADQVLHLFRSMRTVQMALPGVPSQEASAYLCQYEEKKGGGVLTAAVFHMHKSEILAFYYSDPKAVTADKADGAFDQGMNFVESMGFLLADLDIHLLTGDDRDMFWDSLPLRKGADALKSTEEPGAAQKAVKDKAAGRAPATKTPLPKPTHKKIAIEEAVAAITQGDKGEPVVQEGVDDLLAAVEAMRAKRPGLRARKTPPPAEELQRRREQLRENIGRILASM